MMVRPTTARRRQVRQIASAITAVIVLTGAAFGQAPAPGGRGGAAAPQVSSPEVTVDRKIVFRVLAPQADAVRLTASDIAGLGPGTALTKAANGVWETTIGPVAPGAYRYNFNVDGVATIDPRNARISESNANVWSLVVVPGSDDFDTKDVPHGAVAAVTYKSTALGGFRRMHVYTPPGYESGRDRYPVFYLLHGAGDNDHSWTSVGRAGFILDNLIAAKKAKPMIVVMPAGHATAAPNVVGTDATTAMVSDFTTDLMPYVESHYRVLKDRQNTAIAGLSMGGFQTLEVAIQKLDRFAYVGVFSSGLFNAFPNAGRGGAATPPPAAAPGPTEYEKRYAAQLADARLKKGLKVFWFATGKDDFLLNTTQATVAMFKQHGFTPDYVETAGGHTWINWRDYLTAFAPKLF
jgi:enterochelin esterase-like enzyme